MSKKVRQSTQQLWILGIISIAIGFIVEIQGILGYGYSFFSSISASATTHNSTSMTLPFLLGMMAIFCFTYIGHDKWDRILTKLMGFGFSIVAMQPCLSKYNNMLDNIGLLAVSPSTSNLIHMIGALIGFGAMVIWVNFFFTKSNKKVLGQPKATRNKVYNICSIIAGIGILFFIIGEIFSIQNHVWFAEVIILMPMGFAVLVKSELIRWFND